MTDVSPTEPASPTDRILAQVGWVRRLAGRIVADAHLAEDLTQETVAAALENPPREDLALRPWLARVLRNFLNQFARSEGRRRLREEAAARRERSAEDSIAEEVAAQRELADAVLGLEEPYRTAIVMRYFRGQPPREIAAELGVPVKTVNSRITRGLARLRVRLDHARDGDRRAWMLALVSLGDAPRGLAATVLGALAVNVKLICAAVSIAVLATVATWMMGEAGPAAGPDASPVLAAAAPEGPGPLPEPEVRTVHVTPEERVAVPLANQASGGESPEVAAPVETVVRGRVFDAEGAPAPGVHVAFEGRESGVHSGAGGWFELRTTAPRGRIEGLEAGWVTVRMGVFDPLSTLDPVVIVAPAMELAGDVIDDTGWSLPGARVRFELPRSFDTRFGEILESSTPMGWRAATGDDGRFTFQRVPAVAGSTLTAVLDGYAPLRQEAPAGTDMGVVLELRRPTVTVDGALTGRVVDPSGTPVPGARVALGLTYALTDEAGDFRVDLGRAVSGDQMRAVKEGWRPAVLDRPMEPGPQGSGVSGWPDHVELQLGGPALTLSGRVVDHEGAPVGGIRLWISDPTPFGVIGAMPATMENLMAGQPVPPQALEFAAQGPEEDGDSYWDWTMNTGPSSAFWSWVRTDSDGRFEIPGLDDRGYRVKVMDDDTLQTFTSKKVRPGPSSVRIELPAPEVWEELTGQVVTSSGDPLAGVRVRLAHDPYAARSRVFGGRVEFSLNQNRETVTTDEDGRFTFRDVPRAGIYVVLRSDDIVPHRHDFDGLEDPLGIEIEVDARCHVEVVLERTPGVDTLRIFDGDGERLDIMHISDGSVSAHTGIDVVDGRTGVFSISSSARSIQLLADGEDGREVGRLSISPRPGILNLVQD